MPETWKAVLKWLQIGAVATVVLVVAATSYIFYATVWGTPLRFNDLLDRQAIIEVLDSPQLLTQVGLIDGAWYDISSGKLDTYSLDTRRKFYARIRHFDAEIASWDRSRLSPQEQLSYDIARWRYGRVLTDEKYPWLGANRMLYPVNQMIGLQMDLPNFLLSTHQIRNSRLAHHYVSRLKALGPVLDAVGVDVARQAKAGIIPPDFVIDASVSEMKALIAPIPGRNPLVVHLADRTKAIGMAGTERDALVNEAVSVLLGTVYPAYRRLIAEEEGLRQRATHDAGIWRLKGGSDYYAAQLKTLTTTGMTPDEIHEFGLSEVARITAEMDAVFKSVGMSKGTVGQRMDALMGDPRFLYHNDEEGRRAVLARYRQILGHIKLLLPKYFARVPATPLEVRRMPEHAEEGAGGAYYGRPSLDGERPGVFFVNLRDVTVTPMWAMPTLAYHEGVPGHHLQAATAMRITSLPMRQRLGYLAAYNEGWALYTERLVKDMGLYDGDPYGDLGRLQSKLFRAVRLVVDTGIHARKWSRERAITYMQTTTGMAASDVTSEIDRYVVWPGQACAYYIGMKTILDLRERAKNELGAKFNLKEFHAVVLESGVMPLWLLQREVDRWIAQKEGLSAAAR